MRFYASRFIGEREWLPPLRVDVEQAFTILAGLFFHADERVTFGLCFDRADRLAVDEKEVIDFIAIFQKSFADCYSTRSREIDRATVLYDPAALL